MADLTDAARMKANYWSDVAKTVQTRDWMGETMRGAEGLVRFQQQKMIATMEDQMHQRRLAMAAAWEWQRKVDQTRGLEKMFGMAEGALAVGVTYGDVLRGKEHDLNVKKFEADKNAPPKPEKKGYEEERREAINRAWAYFGSNDPASLDPRAIERDLGTPNTVTYDPYAFAEAMQIHRGWGYKTEGRDIQREGVAIRGQNAEITRRIQALRDRGIAADPNTGEPLVDADGNLVETLEARKWREAQARFKEQDAIQEMLRAQGDKAKLLSAYNADIDNARAMLSENTVKTQDPMGRPIITIRDQAADTMYRERINELEKKRQALEAEMSTGGGSATTMTREQLIEAGRAAKAAGKMEEYNRLKVEFQKRFGSK